MNTQPVSRGTLQFTLWGIPITIRPSIWIVLALLGGAFRINDGSDLKEVAIFVVAGVLCLLAHELGHALTGRRFTGTTPTITLMMMCGLTELPIAPRTRAQLFLYFIAGPLAGLVPGVIAALLLGLQLGNIGAGVTFFLLSPFGAEEAMPQTHFMSLLTALHNGTLSFTMLQIYGTFVLISVWWALFNLLPILPLDGGKLLGTITNNIKRTAMVGMLLAGVLALVSIAFNQWFTMVLLGYFAYINWQIFRYENE